MEKNILPAGNISSEFASHRQKSQQQKAERETPQSSGEGMRVKVEFASRLNCSKFDP